MSKRLIIFQVITEIILGYSQNWNQAAFPSPQPFYYNGQLLLFYLSLHFCQTRMACHMNQPTQKTPISNHQNVSQSPLTKTFYSHRPPSPNIHRFFSQVLKTFFPNPQKFQVTIFIPNVHLYISSQNAYFLVPIKNDQQHGDFLFLL